MHNTQRVLTLVRSVTTTTLDPDSRALALEQVAHPDYTFLEVVGRYIIGVNTEELARVKQELIELIDDDPFIQSIVRERHCAHCTAGQAVASQLMDDTDGYRLWAATELIKNELRMDEPIETEFPVWAKDPDQLTEVLLELLGGLDPDPEPEPPARTGWGPFSLPSFLRRSSREPALSRR